MRPSLATQDKTLWKPRHSQLWVVLGLWLVAGCSGGSQSGDAPPAEDLSQNHASHVGRPGETELPTGSGTGAKVRLADASTADANTDSAAGVQAPAALDLTRAERPAAPEGQPPLSAPVGPVKESGEPATGAGRPASEVQAEPQPVDEPRAKPVDLGAPLVEHPGDLVKADPVYPVWLDPKNKRIVVLGRTCRPAYLLEYFISIPEKSYESVVEVQMKAWVVHAGLLSFGIEPGQPVKWDPEYSPPRGPKIEIEVRWKDQQQKVQSARAQDWIRHVKTKMPLEEDFVFTGSGFWKDESTGKAFYQADGGDFVSVLNLPSSMIDLPVRSPSDPESRIFEANAEKMPPPGTPVTLLILAKKT